jgi:hypothetical protein
MSRAERRALIERETPALPIAQQCRLLAVPRAAVYRKTVAVSGEDLAIMALLDRLRGDNQDERRATIRMRTGRSV